MNKVEISAEIVKLLTERNLQLALAESCTGGGIAQAITSVPGASKVFPGGIVSYANEIKQHILGISETILTSFGAVSSECCKEMATGAANIMGTSCSIAVTGIAGPDGGTSQKPVGLVFIGIKVNNTLEISQNIFHGNREEIREQTIITALENFAKYIRKA